MDALAPRLALPGNLTDSYHQLAHDLAAVFGPRLHAVVAFGPRIRLTADAEGQRSGLKGDALALVDRVSINDLVSCGAHARGWDRRGLRMPLLLGRGEFLWSLDAFPLEYDDIIANHVVVVGDDPFGGVAVPLSDLRRACEARAKSHLLHLREGYLEAGGRPADLANLILASASPFSALLGNLARLQGLPGATGAQRAAAVSAVSGVVASVVQRVLQLEGAPLLSADEAGTLYPPYLATAEHLVTWVDTWRNA